MSKFTGVSTELAVTICDDPSDATEKGYFYRPPVYLPIRINKAVVVRKGTEGGKSTVDLIMEDEKGQKYVCMIPHALLNSIPS